MIHPSVDNARQSLAIAKLALERLQKLHEITGLAGWAEINAWLEDEARGRHERLANVGTTHDETMVLRGEVKFNRRVRALPGQVLDDIRALSAKVEGLQAKLAVWHNRNSMRNGQGAQPQEASSKE